MEQTPVRNIWLLRKQFLARKIYFQIKSYWTLQAQIPNINTRKGLLYSLSLLPPCWGQGSSSQAGPSFFPGHCLAVGETWTSPSWQPSRSRRNFRLCLDVPGCTPRSAGSSESSQTQLKKNLERQSRLSSFSPRMSNIESEPNWATSDPLPLLTEWGRIQCNREETTQRERVHCLSGGDGKNKVIPGEGNAWELSKIEVLLSQSALLS